MSRPDEVIFSFLEKAHADLYLECKAQREND